MRSIPSTLNGFYIMIVFVVVFLFCSRFIPQIIGWHYLEYSMIVATVMVYVFIDCTILIIHTMNLANRLNIPHSVERELNKLYQMEVID